MRPSSDPTAAPALPVPQIRVVTVSGWVNTEEVKAKAQATAHGVAGVKQIDNLLVIGKPPRS